MAVNMWCVGVVVKVCSSVLYCRQSGSSVVVTPAEQSSSATHYNYSTLAGTPAQTSAGHGIDALYSADIYGRLMDVSAAPTLCMFAFASQ